MSNPPRQIALTITPATKTSCEGCQYNLGGIGHCQIWDKRCPRGDAIPGSKGGREILRLPECLAAEI